MRRIFVFLPCVLIAFTGVASAGAGTGIAQSTPAGKVTIIRDTYGVPHIFADNPRAASFGLGYAMAEDRLEDIYKNVRTALGSMSEFFGPSQYQIDMAMRLVRNAEVAKAGMEKAPQEVKDISSYYIMGVNQYVKEHPERKPEYAIDLEPWHCLAIGRTMIFRWPLENIFEELGRRDKNNPPFSSNCFAIAPSRTADGSAVLLTDPHLTWEGMAVFYEARVDGGEGHRMNGFFIVGSPMVGLGNNDNVGWAMTTGGPDTSDVYALKLKPGLFPSAYEMDGKWVPMKMRMMSIKVKGEAAPRMQPTFDTEFGPVIEADLEHHVAYAASTPYITDTGMLEQSYAMVHAKTAEEFRKALGHDSLMEQNVMFADRDGNLGYVRVGRTPKRPDGYDWTKPVPGNTSKSKYLGIHDMSDHVQIMNPASGYMQNCNVSPQNMMVDSPMTPDKYISYLYNVSWDKTSPRGTRLVQLLDKNKKATREDAMSFAMDVYDLLADSWKKAVHDAAAEFGQELSASNANFTAAVGDIAEWNGQFVKESTAATVMWRLREKMERQINVAAIAEGKKLTPDDQKKLVQGIADVAAELQKTYKKFPVPWGATHVVGRDGKFFPYDGADFSHGASFTETVRDVEGRKEDPPGSGRYVANSGSMSAMIMFFKKDGVDSYSCTQWGINADPKSPHHTDQSEKLYSQRKFKPSWFKRSELEGHIESEKVLTAP